jgi:glycerate 2-kinase
VTSSEKTLRRDAHAIFRAALDAADAGNAVRKYLRRAPLHLDHFDRIYLVAVGKAAVPMAAAVEDRLGRTLNGGIVVTKDGHGVNRLKHFQCFESGHPIPDKRGVMASEAIEQLCRQLNGRDLLICATSGGASALLPAPVAGLTLKDKQRTTNRLLRAGANIQELNTVRKHLSRLKGGRLAALAYPATIISLLLSDVIGDDPGVIGSGLTAPDSSTLADAAAVMDKFGLRLPTSANETPKPGDPVFQNVSNIIIGSNRLALSTASAEAKRRGYRTLILSTSMQGETREVALIHAQILKEIRSSGNPIKAPACILSGGETTVTVRGKGKGGRNQEFALAAAIEIAGLRDVLVLSGGTDGTDGPTDAAGAIATGTTLLRAEQCGLNALEHLNRNDSYPFFARLGDLIKTGPTGTNVMDVHVLLAR